MHFRRKRRTSVEIGLIPMIDVLLVLLFFFMVATTFRVQSNLHINLPHADAVADQQAISKAINVFIDANGFYSLADASGKVSPLLSQDLLSLKQALAGFTQADKPQPFIINADGKTPHQAVVGVMDIANQLGFHHITFAISPIEKK